MRRNVPVVFALVVGLAIGLLLRPSREAESPVAVEWSPVFPTDGGVLPLANAEPVSTTVVFSAAPDDPRPRPDLVTGGWRIVTTYRDGRRVESFAVNKAR
jgi:hypothetical protein